MSVRDDLHEVRALLEGGWCRGSFAMDDSGKKENPDSPDACRFCLVGAVLRVCRSGTREIGEIVRALEKELGSHDLVPFNDTHTKAQVIAFVSRTIEANP